MSRTIENSPESKPSSRLARPTPQQKPPKLSIATTKDSFVAAPKTSVPKPIDESWSRAVVGLVHDSLDVGVFSKPDTRLAERALLQLPRAELNQAINALEASGDLKKFTEALGNEGQERFFTSLGAKGYLGVELGPTTASAKFDPPTHPRQFLAGPNVPASLAEAVNDRNMGAVQGYYNAYQGYLDRYQTAAAACNSGAELRAMGPHQPLNPTSAAVALNRPDTSKLSQAWIGALHFPSDIGLQKTISDKLSDFHGDLRAGSFFVELKVEAGAKGFGGRAKAKATGEVQLSDYGRVELKKAKIEAEADGVKGSADLKGNTELGVKEGNLSASKKFDANGNAKTKFAASEETPGGESALEFEDGRLTKAMIDGNGLVKEDGRTKIQLNVEGVGAGSFVDPQKGEFGGGLTFKVADGLKVSPSLGFKGASLEDIHVPLNSGGFHARPDELKAKTKWSGLSDDKRDLYSRLGWTEQEWTAAL